MSRSALTVAADLTLVAHASFVAFVVVGQALILIGWMRGWRWTRNSSFRLIHLGAIALVVLESWFGVICPLTWLEFRLRAAAGSPVAADGFLAYWLQRHDLLRCAVMGVHPRPYGLRRGGGCHPDPLPSPEAREPRRGR